MFVWYPACWVCSHPAGFHHCSVTPGEWNSHQPSSRTSICSFIPTSLSGTLPVLCPYLHEDQPMPPHRQTCPCWWCRWQGWPRGLGPGQQTQGKSAAACPRSFHWTSCDSKGQKLWHQSCMSDLFSVWLHLIRFCFAVGKEAGHMKSRKLKRTRGAFIKKRWGIKNKVKRVWMKADTDLSTNQMWWEVSLYRFHYINGIQTAE